MMGDPNQGPFVAVYGVCVGCRATMSFNPHKVPALVVNGVNEPLCRQCFDRWNQIQRIDKGLEPVPLDPRAYDFIQEGEL